MIKSYVMNTSLQNRTPSAIVTATLLIMLISACSNAAPDRSGGGTNASTVAFANDMADESVMSKWARSCALCHISGEAGAPIVGDTVDWQRRLAQGEQSILRRVIEGYNSMPPLGYCMACEEDDFRAMIGYMARTNQ